MTDEKTMKKVILPVNNEVQGNITDCKIETAQIKIDRESILSLTEIKTYQSYDVCTKKVINEYTVKEVSPVGFGWGLGLGVIILFLLVIVAGKTVSKCDPYRRYLD